jgi:acyl carrier protein
MSTLDRLRALLARDFAFKPEALEPGATLESLGVDSLQMLEILFNIEEEFKISVPSDPALAGGRVKTLGDLAAYVDELVVARPPA